MRVLGIALAALGIALGAVGIGFGLAALCAVPHTPNRAIAFVSTIDKNVECDDWGTNAGGDSTALCKDTTATYYCVAGPNAKPHCDVVAQKPATTAPTGSGSGSGR